MMSSTGRFGCGADGFLIETKYSEPMPWIGLYVAAASLICAVAMGADFVYGLRSRRFWFPSKYFTFNAATLTVITVALKLSVDLNTPMPESIDQMAKLSSGVLICIVMGNTMPSLGNMEEKDLMMNVIALVILVITVVTNVAIQIGTGVIYMYWLEHEFVLFLMLIMVFIISFSALTVPTKKKHLEHKYRIKSQTAVEVGVNGSSNEMGRNLREDLMKLWMMAHTCSPQFVMGRSVTCAAIGAICLLAAIALAEAIARTYLLPNSLKFCSGQSDYKWSSSQILLMQTIAIGVGSFGPAIRWAAAINYRCPIIDRSSRGFFTVESYWIHALNKMKESPLSIRTENRFCRKLYYDMRYQLLNFCIGVQIAIVYSCKAVQLLSIFCIGKLLLIFMKFKVGKDSVSVNSSGSDSQHDLRQFVLYLEGEDDLVELMMRKNRDATIHWIRKGKKKASKHLENLIQKSSQGFTGVFLFDNPLISSLEHEEPPNSWSLPIVTLAAISVALPETDAPELRELIRSVNDGLPYVKLVEDNLCGGSESNVNKAAHAIWLGIDLRKRWLDVDLRKLSSQNGEPAKVLEALAGAAKRKFEEANSLVFLCYQKDKPANWPIRMLAANSMQRISKTLLRDFAGGNLFDAIVVMIADVMSACLVSLHRVILLRCLSSSIEERENCIRDSVLLLGKTEKILKLLENRAPLNLQTAQIPWIDEWRKHGRMDHLHDDV